MKRFSWRGWTLLAILNFFLAICFNKLLVRIDHYDCEIHKYLKSEFKLRNRRDYPGEL